jgi:hypothetical protein
MVMHGSCRRDKDQEFKASLGYTAGLHLIKEKNHNHLLRGLEVTIIFILETGNKNIEGTKAPPCSHK